MVTDLLLLSILPLVISFHSRDGRGEPNATHVTTNVWLTFGTATMLIKGVGSTTILGGMMTSIVKVIFVKKLSLLLAEQLYVPSILSIAV